MSRINIIDQRSQQRDNLEQLVLSEAHARRVPVGWSNL